MQIILRVKGGETEPASRHCPYAHGGPIDDPMPNPHLPEHLQVRFLVDFLGIDHVYVPDKFACHNVFVPLPDPADQRFRVLFIVFEKNPRARSVIAEVLGNLGSVDGFHTESLK